MAHSQPNLILSRVTDSDFRLIEAILKTLIFRSAGCWSSRSGAQLLERKGLIVRQRASIVIIDRKALEKLSNGTYAPAVYN